ncbi:MAG: GNAT family N-acetyltransferase [Chlorobiaceae bacterium]
MALAKWNIRLFKSWDEIESVELLDRWEEMMERSANAHVFFHPVLVKVWMETYRPLRNIQPLFVFANCGEQQVIFPLVLWRRNWKNAFLRVIVPAGHSDFDYHDPLYLLPPNQEEVSSFYSALLASIDASVHYDRILLDGLHKEYMPDDALILHQESCLSSYLADVKCSGELVLPSQKSQARELLRRVRRLQEIGSLGFHRFTTKDGSGIKESLDKMLVMHVRRWPNAYKAPGFHQKLVLAGLNAGIVDFVEVQLNGFPIAWHVSFKYHGRYSLYMPALDDSYMNKGTGGMSLGFALFCAVDDGLEIVDHLRGSEEYKSAWGGDETMIYDVVMESRTLRGKIGIVAYNGIRKLKSVFA